MKKFLGAEATVKVGEEVEKNREEKNYRHPELDEKIRKERNSQEVRIFEKARKNGLNVPKVLEESDTKFLMEKIEGKVLKHEIGEKPELAVKLAEQVARLHSIDVIHGDLTTSNAIAGEELYLIDFGLAYHSDRIEDRAVDIHLLKQVFRASHTEELWERFAEKYREEGEEEVVQKVPEIEERARYK